MTVHNDPVRDTLHRLYRENKDFETRDALAKVYLGLNPQHAVVTIIQPDGREYTLLGLMDFEIELSFSL